MPLLVGGTATETLSAYVTDDDDDLTCTASSSMPAYATVSAPDDASMITITAVAAGMATITVTVDDGTNDAVSRSFTVTVSEAPVDNEPPVILTSNPIPDVAAADFRIGATKDYDLSKHFDDPDNDTLTYGATSADSAVAEVTTPDAGGKLTLTAVGKARHDRHRNGDGSARRLEGVDVRRGRRLEAANLHRRFD